MTAVLIAGVPRSGTSWVGRILGATPGAVYLNEPDNHQHVPYALRAKLGINGGFFPCLEGDERAPAYERLWAEAFSSIPANQTAVERLRTRLALGLVRRASQADLLAAIDRPDRAPVGLRAAVRLAVPARPVGQGKKVVVKSVHSCLSAGWISDRFASRVLVVHRDPMKILSSWKAMGWLGGASLAELGSAAPELARRLGIPHLRGASPLEEGAQLIGLLAAALLATAVGFPDWLVVSHEALYRDPAAEFRAAASALGLEWDNSSERLLEDLDREGSGYETARLRTGLDDVWRTRLTPDEVVQARKVFDRFEIDWSVPSDRGDGRAE